jgi:hypothetical protein
LTTRQIVRQAWPRATTGEHGQSAAFQLLRDDDAVLEFDLVLATRHRHRDLAKEPLMPLPEWGAPFPDHSNPVPARARLAAAG